MSEHELKTMPGFFDDIIAGRKTFEVRRDDRGFQEGDTLLLREYYANKYSGRETRRRIAYVLRDFDGIVAGFVVLGLGIVVLERTRSTS